MAGDDVFSQAALNDIFKISPRLPDCVNSRESSWLEFKESFSWGNAADYARTLAAFANAKGGYIVFGIKDSPHKLVGLRQKPLQAFERIDPEKVTEFFNQHFAPELTWNIHVHEVIGKPFGLLYVHESSEKPVVCTADSGDRLREGDIYYRYRGRSTRIRYPELRKILERRRDEEQKMWLKHLAKIARVGVRDAGVFDLQSGQVSGTGGTFVIDESLLSQLAFIKKGEFSQSAGKPTLRLIGSVEAVSGSPEVIAPKQVVKSRGIRISDIVLAFLDKQKVDDPREYINQICFESTAFLPVYYFMSQAELEVHQAIETIDKVVCRGQTKGRLLGRLRMQTTQQMAVPTTESPAAKRKKQCLAEIKRKAVKPDVDLSKLRCCLHAIRMLTTSEVSRLDKYLRDLLRKWFNRYYATEDGALADHLRRAICWVDEAMYMPSPSGDVDK